MTIRCMRLACWITKAKNTHLEYIIPIAFPLQQWLCKRSSMLLYVHCLSLFFFLRGRGGRNSKSFVQWQRYSLVNGRATKRFQKHPHFTRTSTNTVTRQLQTAKRKHSREYNRHHIQLVLPSVIAQVFYAIYDTSYVRTCGNKSYITKQTSWRLVLNF